MQSIFQSIQALLSRKPSNDCEGREFSTDELRQITSTQSFLYEKGTGFLDDITWNDLSMDAIYAKLALTKTLPGDAAIYNLLRNPATTPDPLDDRVQSLKWIQAHRVEGAAMRQVLSKTNRRRATNLEAALEAPAFGGWLWICTALSAILAVSLTLAFLGWRYGIIIATISFAVNTVTGFLLNARLAYAAEGVGDLLLFLRCSRELCKQKEGNFPFFRSLHALMSGLRGIPDRGILSVLYDTNPLTLFINYSFLLSAVSYLIIARKIRRRKRELKQMLALLGLIDAMLAIDVFRQEAGDWCEPTWCTDIRLKASGIYHPLLRNGVRNDIDTQRHILLTGSNASGKSTFLKTLAVNAILGQSVLTCMAECYEAPLYKVQSSMALRDDIHSGKSYFIVEIQSIKRMYDDMKDNTVPHLLLIDEVLRGTNTIERIAASTEILSTFSRLHCLCVAATHDLDLTYALDGVYANYHFAETLDNEGVRFDFVLRKGRSLSRNAIALLAMIGFDAEVVERAEARARALSRETGNP